MALKKIHFTLKVDPDKGMYMKVSQITGDME
jgi:hypothetical protein